MKTTTSNPADRATDTPQEYSNRPAGDTNSLWARESGMKNALLSSKILVAAVAAALMAAPTAWAASITKAGSGTDLTAGASWTGSIAPTPNDLAIWDAGSLGTGLTLNSGTPGWLGIKVNAGASDPINIGSGGTLTNGSSGIDMSAATINTTLGCDLSLASGYQSWLVASGRTLAINGTVSRASGAAVNFPATGVTSTTMANNNGILGGWATTGNAGTAGASGDWAANDGSGNIVAYAGYTAVSGGTTGSGASTLNWLDTDGTASLTASANVNSLVMRADFNIQSGATLTLDSGGLLLSGASKWLKNNGAGNTTGTAQITSGLAGGELFVDSSGSGGSGDNDWRIWPKIVDNGATPVILVKNGSGYVRLPNANTYSGGTILNGGRVLCDNTTSPLGTGPITINGNVGIWLNVNLTTSAALSGAGTLDNTVGTGGASWNITGDINNFTGTIMHFCDNSHNNVNFGGGTANSIDASRAKFILSGNNGQARKVSLNGFGVGNFLLGDLSGSSGSLNLNNSLNVGYLNLNSSFGGLIMNGANTPAVTKVGTGSLTLSGASTYPGVTTIENGSLIAGANVPAGGNGPFGNAASEIALGDAASESASQNVSLLVGGAFTMARPVTVGAGNATTATFTLGGNTANSAILSGAIALNQNLIITQATGGTLTISGGIIDNIGGLTVAKVGGGTVVLSGVNSYTGLTAVNNGVLMIGSSSQGNGTVAVADGAAAGVLATADATYWFPSSLTVGSSTGGTLQFNLGGTITGPNANTLLTPASLTLNGLTTIVIGSCPQTLGSYPLFNNYSSGSLVLGSQPAGVLGKLTVSSGTVYYQVTNFVTAVWTAAVNTNWDTVTANWTNTIGGNKYVSGYPVLLDDTATGVSPLLVNITGAVTPNSVTVNATNKAYVLGGSAISGATGVTKNGNNTLTLTGTNSFTGDITVSAGTLEIGGAGQLGAGSYAGNIGVEGTLENSSAAAQTLSGTISGNGVLIQNGTNTLTLSGANTFVGGVNASNGIVGLANDAGLGVGDLTLNGGALQNVNGGADINCNNNIVVGSGGSVSLGLAKNLSLNGSLSGSGNLVLGGSTPLASLNVNFSGNYLSGGTITIPPSTGNNQTVVRLKSVNVGNAGIVWSIGGAQDRYTTLDFVDGVIEFGALTGVGTIACNGAGARTVQVGGLNTDSTFAGRFLDNGGVIALNKVGTGKLTLTGANSIMTGGLNINDGILNVGSANALSATTPITFGGGMLQYSSANQADYSAQFANSGGPIVIDLNGTNVTYASAIPSSNYGGLVLTNSTGSGGLTLTANSLYSGDTIITPGSTLALSGAGNISGTGNIIVSNGAVLDVSAATSYVLGGAQTLSGSGTVTGAVTTASSGATISPAGAGGLGVLTFKSALTMTSGGAAVFDLGGNHVSGNDQVVVNGNLRLSAADTIHINAMTGGGNLDETGDYVLFSVTGSLTMNSVPVVVFDNTPPGDSANWWIKASGNNVVLHYSVNPPPLVVSVTVTNVADGSTIVTRGQSVTVYATVQKTLNNISSVTVDLSAIGGSASQAMTLVGNSGNNFDYTYGPIMVGPSATVGVDPIGLAATDTASTVGTGGATLTVNATTETWSGLAANNDWSSGANWTSGLAPGYSGDTLIFTGDTRLSPNLEANYDVAGLTFDGAAGSFTIGSTSGKSLALSGSLNNNSPVAQTVSASVVLNAGFSINDNGSGVTLSGAVSGSDLTVASGNVTLAGANTYSGNTVVSSGSLKVANGAAIPSGAGKGSVVVSSGAVLDANGANVSMNGLSDAGIVDNTAAGAASVTLGNGNVSSTFAGTIQNAVGALSLVKVGSGAFTISKNNTYSGTTKILGGSVILPNGADYAFSTNALTLSNATLVVQAGGGGSWDSPNACYLGNNLIVPTGTTNVIDDSVNNFGNLWAGGDNVQWTGSGVIKFQNNGNVNNPGMIWNGSPLATFNGTIILGSANGTNSSVFNGLAYSSNAGGGTGAAVTTFDSAGTAWNLGDIGYSLTQVADSTCTTVRMGSISGSNTNTILRGNNSSSPTTFEVGALNTSTTFGGKITDFGAGGTALTKVGSGSLTLLAANSYTGPTTVSNGTLLVNGALTSPVTVAGGVFGGTGSVTANVAVNSGGTLSPGASVGTLTINGNLSLSGNMLIELNKSLFPAQSNDFVNVTGTLTYGGTLTVNILGPALAAGNSFRLFPAGGSGSLTVAGSPGSGLAYSFNDGVLSVITSGPGGAGVITNHISGSTLMLTWPSGQSWRLVSQTNSLSVGLNPNPSAWSTVPGTSDGSYSITIDPTKPSVFYRLVNP